ncbi:MAG: Hsp20/alpha crystallin family protein [Fidelibacterota bacterium]|nr:MAG: Hsp20/alpha crystallin family protein [Candidatus Neomarinimicrobiota bacterium]
MTLVKYTRRRPVLSLYDDMNSLFNQVWSRPFFGDVAVRRNWAPAFDIRETKDQITFEAELPGLSKKDIDISLQDGVLTVSGEREAREVTENEALHCSELRYGKFVRSFSLPAGVDEDKVEAKYNNGILTIALNKTVAEEPERKKIAIK